MDDSPKGAKSNNHRRSSYFVKLLSAKDAVDSKRLSFHVEPTAQKKKAFAEKTMFDFKKSLKKSLFPFNWDHANFFITMVVMGGVYTEKGGNIRQGYLRFIPNKLLMALTFKRTIRCCIVGIPQAYNESQFVSAPFKRGEIVYNLQFSWC